jgi:LPXTG-motif cell wall-anchored protein
MASGGNFGWLLAGAIPNFDLILFGAVAVVLVVALAVWLRRRKR